MLQEMTDEKARHVLELSRALRWEFPSSQGTPIIRGQAASQNVEQATRERESYADAARVLLENGNDDEKARHVLELSRALRWEFPSSQGTPIIRGQAASQNVEQATRERESYADAARVLLENGNEEGRSRSLPMLGGFG